MLYICESFQIGCVLTKSLRVTFGKNSDSSVEGVKLRRRAHALAKVVAKRDTVVVELERAITLGELDGAPLLVNPPTHSITESLKSITTAISYGKTKKVDAVELYYGMLKELNAQVAEMFEKIEAFTLLDGEENNKTPTFVDTELTSPTGDTDPFSNNIEGSEEVMTQREARSVDNNSIEENIVEMVSSVKTDQPDIRRVESGICVSSDDSLYEQDCAEEAMIKKRRKHSVLTSATNTASFITSNITSEVTFMLRRDDGEHFNSGFIVFRNLNAVHSALQTVQSENPYEMKMLHAPHPEAVMWNNVGTKHEALQHGRNLSKVFTVALCLLWAIPMAFVGGLSSLEGLRNHFEKIDEAVQKHKWLEQVLLQLAPLLVVALNSLLPFILKTLTLMEFPIGLGQVEYGIFSKFSVFQVINTFFISLLSGSLISQLGTLAKNPTMIIDILATSLPSKSSYFIQILFTTMVLGLSTQMLQVSRIAMATVRKYVGPKATEKDRRTPFMGIRPLEDPSGFSIGQCSAVFSLFFMTLFVYAVIAPIASFIITFCFLTYGTCYLHELIYIYPNNIDSGGRLWVHFYRLTLITMVVAEIVLLAILGLKKFYFGFLLIPIIITTIKYVFQMSARDFSTAMYLPMIKAIEADDARKTSDFDFVTKAYKQPEMREKVKYPENLSPEMMAELDIRLALNGVHPKSDLLPIVEETPSEDASGEILSVAEVDDGVVIDSDAQKLSRSQDDKDL